ncbi:NUDIX domain-containing protein [Streptomyces sp. NPDC127190]|uniref:NUDIX domain-containing protein n=1 Tax=unclassified Streptomyces TaxID=2593676 RepID=UPI003628979A
MSTTHLNHAMVLLQRDDGRVLAVRHNAVTVIGGKPAAGEFLDDGALRAAAEEAGVRVARRDLEFCQTVHCPGPDGRPVIAVAFTAQRWLGEPRNAAPHQHDGILWIDPGRPPSDCHPVTRQILATFTAGRLYADITAPATGGGA